MTPQIPNYEIKQVLGEGGMATVYLAHNIKFGTNVALKLLKKEFIHNSNIRARFIAEARNMFRMSHQQIIKVTDLIDDGDTVAFVMEYIEGETLKEYLDRKGKLNEEEIGGLLEQMLSALEYAHEQGLVHRDIKPSNFMVSPQGRLKLLDFGIAKQTNTASAEYTNTGTNQRMGTAMYMSPEQIHETRSVTPRSDIYSLGVVLWQMVSGQKPYSTETLSAFQLQLKIVNEPLPLTGTNWDSLIQKATEKDSQHRYSDISSFRSAWQKGQNDLNERRDSENKTVIEQQPKQLNIKETTIIENPGKKEKKIRPFNWVLLLFVLFIVCCVGFIIWKKVIIFPAEEKQELSFSPTIETVPVSSVFKRDALSGGTISSDGGSEILEKGIVWSTNQNPDISLSTKTNEGGNSSNFISKLTNLSPDTRYYVRAYATNSVGTEYGQEQTFMTVKEAVVFSGSVSIGSQVWQTKNLNVDRFRNGDPIPEARTKDAWKEAGERGEPAWCYYENNASNGSIYGKLYNWHAATDSRRICPPGWHLPSDKEWTALTNYLGGEDVAGGKMKSRGTAYWNSPNEGATNDSGFSALPGGARDGNGSFNGVSYNAFFWSATVYDNSSAWYRNLYYYNGFVYRNIFNNKSVGASVRCLRD